MNFSTVYSSFYICTVDSQQYKKVKSKVQFNANQLASSRIRVHVVDADWSLCDYVILPVGVAVADAICRLAYLFVNSSLMASSPGYARMCPLSYRAYRGVSNHLIHNFGPMALDQKSCKGRPEGCIEQGHLMILTQKCPLQEMFQLAAKSFLYIHASALISSKRF